MVYEKQIGSLGVKDMTFDKKSYNIRLRDRVWKLLPVYEGKGKSGEIVCSGEEALKRFRQNLNRVITEISGAESIFSDNNRYAELINILNGLKYYGSDKHDELKDVIFYCCDILEDIGGDSFV